MNKAAFSVLSSRLLFEDHDSGLFSVTLFRKAIDDFKHKARENKYTFFYLLLELCFMFYSAPVPLRDPSFGFQIMFLSCVFCNDKMSVRPPHCCITRHALKKGCRSIMSSICHLLTHSLNKHNWDLCVSIMCLHVALFQVCTCTLTADCCVSCPRFTVRDFQYNEEELKADKEEMTRLCTDKKKQFVRLLFSAYSVTVEKEDVPGAFLYCGCNLAIFLTVNSQGRFY